MKIRICKPENSGAVVDFRVTCDDVPVVDFTRTLGKLQIMMGGEYAMMEQSEIKAFVFWLAGTWPELFQVEE